MFLLTRRYAFMWFGTVLEYVIWGTKYALMWFIWYNLAVCDLGHQSTYVYGRFHKYKSGPISHLQDFRSYCTSSHTVKDQLAPVGDVASITLGVFTFPRPFPWYFRLGQPVHQEQIFFFFNLQSQSRNHLDSSECASHCVTLASDGCCANLSCVYMWLQSWLCLVLWCRMMTCSVYNMVATLCWC